MLTLTFQTLVGNFVETLTTGGSSTYSNVSTLRLLVLDSLCTRFDHDDSDDSLGGSVDVGVLLRNRIQDSTGSVITNVILAGGGFGLNVFTGSFEPTLQEGGVVGSTTFGIFPLDGQVTGAELLASLTFSLSGTDAMTGTVQATWEGTVDGTTTFSVTSGTDDFSLLVNNCLA